MRSTLVLYGCPVAQQRNSASMSCIYIYKVESCKGALLDLTCPSVCPSVLTLAFYVATVILNLHILKFRKRGDNYGNKANLSFM